MYDIPLVTPVEWVAHNKDLLALLISLLALLVGLATTVIALLAARRQAQRDTYARMHETLVAPSVAQGRRKLFVGYREGRFPTFSEPGWDEINQALALYDTLGTYYHRQLVPQDLLLAAWHHPLKAVTQPAKAFVAHRQALDIRQPWPMLDELLEAAANVPCPCNYCEEFRRSKVKDTDDTVARCTCDACMKVRAGTSRSRTAQPSSGGSGRS